VPHVAPPSNRNETNLSNVENHQRVVAVGRVVGDAVFVGRAERPVVVEPLAHGRRARVDLAPEVRHRAVVEMLVSHRLNQPRCRHARRFHALDACSTNVATISSSTLSFPFHFFSLPLSQIPSNPPPSLPPLPPTSFLPRSHSCLFHFSSPPQNPTMESRGYFCQMATSSETRSQLPACATVQCSADQTQTEYGLMSRGSRGAPSNHCICPDYQGCYSVLGRVGQQAIGGDDRGCSSIFFLIQRISDVVQRFNSVLLQDK